jgi:hypothetical protein
MRSTAELAYRSNYPRCAELHAPRSRSCVCRTALWRTSQCDRQRCRAPSSIRRHAARLRSRRLLRPGAGACVDLPVVPGGPRWRTLRRRWLSVRRAMRRVRRHPPRGAGRRCGDTTVYRSVNLGKFTTRASLYGVRKGSVPSGSQKLRTIPDFWRHAASRASGGSHCRIHAHS